MTREEFLKTKTGELFKLQNALSSWGVPTVVVAFLGEIEQHHNRSKRETVTLPEGSIAIAIKVLQLDYDLVLSVCEGRLVSISPYQMKKI